MADSLASTPVVEKERLFGRKKSVHELLGGKKLADVLLWKEWRTSAAAVGTVALIWYLFEVSGFTLLTLLANTVLLVVAAVFVWSRVAKLLNRPPPPLPELAISEETVVSAAQFLRKELNSGLALAHDVALGKDFVLLAKTLAALYAIGVLGSWFNSLTLIFVLFLLGFTLPALYDKFEDQVDEYADIAVKQAIKVFKQVEEQVQSVLHKKTKKTE